MSRMNENNIASFQGSQIPTENVIMKANSERLSHYSEGRIEGYSMCELNGLVCSYTEHGMLSVQQLIRDGFAHF